MSFNMMYCIFYNFNFYTFNNLFIKLLRINRGDLDEQISKEEY